MGELQPQHTQSYYADKLRDGRADGKGGLSARSVVYHHRILSKALDYAVKMGLVVRNVAKVVQPPKMARNKMNTLSPKEVTRFLDAARETDYYYDYSDNLSESPELGMLTCVEQFSDNTTSISSKVRTRS